MLEPAAHDANCFEVCIGGDDNSATSLRFGTRGPTVASAPGRHANAAEYEPYWVHFHNGRLAVGTGTHVDLDELVAAEMPPIAGAEHHHLSIGFAGDAHEVDVICKHTEH